MNIQFIIGPGNYKYTAIINDKKKVIKVNFGNKNYSQYKDKIGAYSHLDHLDENRRLKYRARHSRIKNKIGKLAYKIKYSPAWFSWHFLW